jgi:hypothetical protein
MKLRRVRSAFPPPPPYASYLSEISLLILTLFNVVFPIFTNAVCSICIFDCRRQEAAVGCQGACPHAHQALKVDCQEVSLRQRMSFPLARPWLALFVDFCFVCPCCCLCWRLVFTCLCWWLVFSSSAGSQGTNTFDRYEMRIYKRVIDVDTSVETIRTLVRIVLGLIMICPLSGIFLFCMMLPLITVVFL